MTAPSIESFEEAVRLDTNALRGLLDGPRPEQRVWAIWALALRNQDVVGLAQRTAIEHDPGVRRTLAVILASHGETDLLVALARHDPALVVRASAMQLVTRLAAGGAIDRAVVLEAERREPEIRSAILAAIDASSPGFLVELADRLIDGDDDAVQLEAFEAFVRIATPASLARITRWLDSRDPQLVAQGLRRWAGLADGETIARAVAPLALHVRASAVQELPASSWSSFEQLIGGEPSLGLLAALRPDVRPPLAFLHQLLIDVPGAQALTAVNLQLSRMSAVPDAGVALSALAAQCRARHARLEAERASIERETVAAEDDPQAGPRAKDLLRLQASVRIDEQREERYELAALGRSLDRLRAFG